MSQRWKWAIAASLAAALGCGAWVQHTRLAYGLQDNAQTPRKSTLEGLPGMINSAFWETRRSFALIAWNEAQTYFHKGFDLTVFLPNKDAEKKAALRLEQDPTAGHEHDHDHEGEELDIHSQEEKSRILSLENHPFLRQSPLRPYVFKHGAEIGTQRMMPFYWLTTLLDPNFVRAYQNGAYWLAFHFKKPQEAIRYLDLGLRKNPSDPSLLGMRGHIYFSVLKDYSKAVQDLELAYISNPRKNEEQCDEALAALRYLAQACLAQHDYDGTIGAACRGKRINPEAIGFDLLISRATTALEGHPQ